MKNIVLLTILSIILLCSSCVVSFENPIADSQSTLIDKRLSGAWIMTQDGKKLRFEFFSNSNSETILKLIDEKNNDEKNAFTVTSAQIGKYNYLSLKAIDEDNDEPDVFLIIKYEIVGDEMTIWFHDKLKIEELVRQGKLKGTLKSYGEISVSNSSAELRQFLESTESDELFTLLGKSQKQ